MPQPTRRGLMIGAAALPFASPARAQAWPQRFVRIVVPQPAGNSPDVLCRIIADRLSRALGQQFIVDNRPGPANVLGTQHVATAAPDGYTFLFATSAALSTNPFTYRDLPYDPVRDFTPVALVARSNHVLLVHPSVRASTLAELIALEKAAPGSMSIAIDGPRNLSGLLARYLNSVAGTAFELVPYNNMGTAIQDSIAGRTQVTIQSVSVATPHIRAGSLRPLAVIGVRRVGSLPDVPAIAETLPAIQLQGWFMVMAPARTPMEIVRKLSESITQILRDPDIQRRAADLGFEVDPEGPVTPEGAADYLRRTLELAGTMVRTLGIEPE